MELLKLILRSNTLVSKGKMKSQ